MPVDLYIFRTEQKHLKSFIGPAQEQVLQLALISIFFAIIQKFKNVTYYLYRPSVT